MSSPEAQRIEQTEGALLRRDSGSGRRAVLTNAGLAERAELDRRSNDMALRILEPLSERQRATLVAAMTEVERLLQASMVHFAVEDPTTPDAGWCFEQYFAELDERFDAGFDPALGISADAHELVPPAGALLIARLRERPVGCGGLKLHGDAPAELKRMWIAPAARGVGVGRRLLQELERHAHEAGVAVLRLETNHVLSEAIALLPALGIPRGRRLQQRAVCAPLVRKAAVLAVTFLPSHF